MIRHQLQRRCIIRFFLNRPCNVIYSPFANVHNLRLLPCSPSCYGNTVIGSKLLCRLLYPAIPRAPPNVYLNSQYVRRDTSYEMQIPGCAGLLQQAALHFLISPLALLGKMGFSPLNSGSSCTCCTFSIVIQAVSCLRADIAFCSCRECGYSGEAGEQESRGSRGAAGIKCMEYNIPPD
ncbi:hypothetical protein D3C75_279420 [compost metagenome]